MTGTTGTTGTTDIAEDYASAGFGQRLGFGTRPAVLVVDLVQAYLEPASPLYAGVESTVPATAELLQAARTAAVPVIFTTVHFEPGTEGGPFFRKARGLSLFVGDSPLGRLATGLERRPDEPLLRKRFASAFFDTTLAADLARLQVDSVLIAGLSTSGCVRATAVDAVQLGLTPLVVREAVGDRDAAPHEAALFDLNAKYADVISLEDAVSHLTSLASAGPSTE